MKAESTTRSAPGAVGHRPQMYHLRVISWPRIWSLALDTIVVTACAVAAIWLHNYFRTEQKPMLGFAALSFAVCLTCYAVAKAQSTVLGVACMAQQGKPYAALVRRHHRRKGLRLKRCIYLDELYQQYSE